jgi:monovalent cation/hydrogen antiporter
VQGLSLPAVLRWSRVPPDPTQAYEEALATRTAFRSAAATLPGIADRLGTPPEVRDRLLAEFRTEADKLDSAMDDDALSVRPRQTDPIDRERELRHAVIPGKRKAVLGLRHADRIDDIVLRRIQALLDAEELRLTEYENEGA